MSTMSSMIHYIDNMSTPTDPYLCGKEAEPDTEFSSGTITKAEVTCQECTRILTMRERRNDREHPIDDPHTVTIEAFTTAAKEVVDERVSTLEHKVDDLMETLHNHVEKDQ